MPLVIGRRTGERVRLTLPDGRAVWVTVTAAGRDSVRLAFDAPADVRIMRESLLPAAERHGEGRPT